MEEGKRPVVVAVIDSGIDASKSDLSRYVVKSTGFRVDAEGYIIEDTGMEVKHPHGTLIAMIIRQICPQVRLLSINILNEKLATDGRVLIYALDKVLDLQPDIIHMSLGTTKWRHRFPLDRLVKNALKRNILVVSAANNQGHKSYPAYLKGVIGVKSQIFKDYSDYCYRDGFFHAYPGVENIQGVMEVECSNAKGNSMAAAYVTGHASCLISRNDSYKVHEIMESLKNREGVVLKL